VGSLIVGLILFGSLYVLLYEIIVYFQQRSSPSYKKIKAFQKELKGNEHILDRLANLLMPLIQRIPRKDKITLFIQRAGSPYNLDFNRYVVIKTLGTIAMFYISPKTLVMGSIYVAIGFFGVDILLWAKKRKRQEEILKELPFMMTKIARSSGNGIPVRELLMVLSSRLEGPLKDEVTRLSAHYNIDGNLSHCLPVFSTRIGMEEVDNMCIAMIQSEQSGKMRAILEKQAEILKRRASFSAFKSTKNRSNFLPLTTVGMVICIFLLVAVPMFLVVASNGLFK
jgi:Flp pilus assembly protein TadB